MSHHGLNIVQLVPIIKTIYYKVLSLIVVRSVCNIVVYYMINTSLTAYNFQKSERRSVRGPYKRNQLYLVLIRINLCIFAIKTIVN